MEWLTIFLINWLLNVLAIEFLALRKIQPMLDVNEARDSKFSAYRRLDVKWINRPWLFMTCHFCIAKILFAFVSLFICGVVCKSMVIGHKQEDPINGVRYFFIRAIQWWTSNVVLFCGNTGIWQSYTRSDICYKKYLGPDWEPDFNQKNVGCIVGNHSTFLDTAFNSKQQLASFVAKYEAAQILFVGDIMRASQCLILNRESKESKKLVQDQISKRIQLAEVTDNFDPIVIFPEGGTSNGKYLCQFKRGAFVGLRAVMPKVAKQKSWFQSPSSGILEGLPHYLICSCLPFSWAEVTLMPIFKPNDYFFKHHQQEGEEKYQTYMRVVRHLIAEVGNFELSNQSIEDKFEYKKLLWPKKHQAHKEPLKGASSN